MIKITDGWYMDADSSAYNLYNWDGTYKFRDGIVTTERANCKVFYYSLLPDLFDGLVKRLLREKMADCDTFDELLEKMKETNLILKDLRDRWDNINTGDDGAMAGEALLRR